MKTSYDAGSSPTAYPSNPKKKFRPCFISADSHAPSLSDCYVENNELFLQTYSPITEKPVDKTTKERMKVLYLCQNDNKVIYNPSDESEQGKLKWLGITDTISILKSVSNSELSSRSTSTSSLRTITVNSTPPNIKTPIPIRATPNLIPQVSINVTSSTTTSPMLHLNESGDRSKRSFSQVTTTTTTINILYAEDNVICRTMTTNIAKLAGIQCDTVTDGLECCKKIEENPQQYHLILMDVIMPGMGGIDATERIRQLGYKIPIIAVSCDESKDIEQRCTTAGMNGFLKKPLTISKLKEVLQQKINKV